MNPQLEQRPPPNVESWRANSLSTKTPGGSAGGVTTRGWFRLMKQNRLQKLWKENWDTIHQVSFHHKIHSCSEIQINFNQVSVSQLSEKTEVTFFFSCLFSLWNLWSAWPFLKVHFPFRSKSKNKNNDNESITNLTKLLWGNHRSIRGQWCHSHRYILTLRTEKGGKLAWRELVGGFNPFEK